MADACLSDHAGRRRPPPAKPPIWNDPVWRGAVLPDPRHRAVVVWSAHFLVNNTHRQPGEAEHRLRLRLPRAAPPASASARPLTSSSARRPTPTAAPSWSGLLNTIFVSVWGIILATILGFIIGVAAPVRQLAGLQAGDGLHRDAAQHPAAAADLLLVLRGAAAAAVAARQRRAVRLASFSTTAAWPTPRPFPGTASATSPLAFVVGDRRDASSSRAGRKKRQDATGAAVPGATGPASASSSACRCSCSSSRACPLQLRVPGAQGLQLPGRHGDVAGVRGAAAGAVPLHGGVHRRDRARRASWP